MRKVQVFENMWDLEKPDEIAERKIIAEGWFHCFGLEAGFHEGQSSNWTVAIIELPDGSVIYVNLDSFRFVEKPSTEKGD